MVDRTKGKKSNKKKIERNRRFLLIVNMTLIVLLVVNFFANLHTTRQIKTIQKRIDILKNDLMFRSEGVSIFFDDNNTSIFIEDGNITIEGDINFTDMDYNFTSFLSFSLPKGFGEYNLTYKNTTITGDNLTLLKEVKSYLSISDGIPYISTIYVDDYNGCYGWNDEDYIYLDTCDETWDYRKKHISPEEWLAFVLYHEIAHEKFNVTTECQCLCDDYAIKMIKKLDLRS